jgi:hypothetical protein
MYRLVRFSTLDFKFSNVVGKCFLVQQNVYTVFKLRKTCSSCRNSGAHDDGSISIEESGESLSLLSDFVCRRFPVGAVAGVFRLARLGGAETCLSSFIGFSCFDDKGKFDNAQPRIK